MTTRDPASAPARPDLVFLRRRTARVAASAPVAVAPQAETRSSNGVDYVHHRPEPAPAPTPTPTWAPAPKPVPSPVLDPLDLSEPEPPIPARGSDSPVAPTSAGATPAAPSTPGFEVARVRAGKPVVLSPLAPTLTLTRLQSGVGTLTIEAACSAAVGDLRLGCAWELRSGLSSVVQASTGVAAAPPGSKRPVIVGDRSNFERLRIDLRQARELNRLVVYAFSESGGTLDWGGTLVVSTFGGARVELPLDRPAAASVQVLLSLYNVGGEFVLRAEMEQFPGSSIRQAVDAYDFHRVSWIDSRNPLI